MAHVLWVFRWVSASTLDTTLQGRQSSFTFGYAANSAKSFPSGVLLGRCSDHSRSVASSVLALTDRRHAGSRCVAPCYGYFGGSARVRSTPPYRVVRVHLHLANAANAAKSFPSGVLLGRCSDHSRSVASSVLALTHRRHAGSRCVAPCFMGISVGQREYARHHPTGSSEFIYIWLRCQYRKKLSERRVLLGRCSDHSRRVASSVLALTHRRHAGSRCVAPC